MVSLLVGLYTFVCVIFGLIYITGFSILWHSFAVPKRKSFENIQCHVDTVVFFSLTAPCELAYLGRSTGFSSRPLYALCIRAVFGPRSHNREERNLLLHVVDLNVVWQGRERFLQSSRTVVFFRWHRLTASSLQTRTEFGKIYGVQFTTFACRVHSRRVWAEIMELLYSTSTIVRWQAFAASQVHVIPRTFPSCFLVLDVGWQLLASWKRYRFLADDLNVPPPPRCTLPLVLSCWLRRTRGQAAAGLLPRSTQESLSL